MRNYKYKLLETNSYNSDDVDDVDYVDNAPLLKTNNTHSVLLNIDDQNNKNNQNNNNQNNQNNKNKNNCINNQFNFNLYSRNIVKFFLIILTMISFALVFIILGGIDYYNTESNQILYGSHGEILFKYYYIINFCQYIIFLIFLIYLLLYIICCSIIYYPIHYIIFLNMFKINLGIFSLNIILKMIYVGYLIFLADNNLETSITKIPKYYNYIIIENNIYFIIQIVNLFFLNKINIFINYYYSLHD
jgi:hypothetical protein